MKFLMFNPFSAGPRVCLAPATAPDGEDADGGDNGNGDNDDDDDSDDTDDGDNDDDDDSDDSDDDTDDDDDSDDTDDDTDDDDDDDDAKDKELGVRAQKRIRKLIAQRKEATARLDAVQRQLDEAKKLTGDDGKALIKAAEVSGILPGLMTKNEAEAFRDLADYPRVIEGLEDWLDDHEEGDEYEVGGKTLTYGQVKKRLRKLRGEYADLKDEYGARRKELQKKVRGIFELGLKAQEAGWSPDSKKKPAKKTERKKLHDKPVGKKKPAAKSGKKANWGDIGDEKDFVRMIAASNAD